MTAPTWLNLALVAAYTGVLFWGAIEDIRSRTIPNAVVISLIFLYILYSIAGFADWTSGLVGGLIIFIPSFALFHFGAMGGGDAKLMTVIALWVGQEGVLAFCILTSLAGGFLALFFMARRWYQSRNVENSQPDEQISQAIVLPYGVAIAVGGLSIVWLWQLTRLGVFS